LFVPGLNQLVHQGGGGDEADRQALLAGRQPQPERNVRLAGAAVADRDDVLTARDVLAAGKLQDQGLVQRGERHEVETVEAFHRREPRLLDATFDHPAFPLDQFEFGQAQQIAGMIDPFGGALLGELVVFAQEGRQPERLEMMGKQELRRIAHGAAPASRSR
jgi:hypothetical protein